MNQLLAVLSGKGSDIQQLPLIYCSSSLTARILRCPVQEYLEQPKLMANSVSSIKQLFGPDGIVLGYNPTLVVECYGSRVEYPGPDRLPVCASGGKGQFVRTKALDSLVQAIQWAKKISGDSAIIAAVPGVSYIPDANLDLEEKFEMVIRVATNIVEANPDIIAVYEREALAEDYERRLGTLLNVLEHYKIASLLVAQQIDVGQLEFRRLNGILVDCRSLPLVSQGEGTTKWGGIIDVEAGSLGEEMVPSPRHFASTPWEVEGSVPIHKIRLLLGSLRLRGTQGDTGGLRSRVDN